MTARGGVARRPEPFRARLRRGERLVGLAACVMRSVEIVTVARSAGFDWLLVDTEHTALGIGDVASLAACGAEAGFPVLARVGGPHHPDLARVLDVGAAGLVVPHVDTLEEAKQVVARCRFSPVGCRSIPGPQVRLGFAVPPVREMMAAVEADTAIVLMVETRPGVEAADAVAALAGVDAVMIGANDLADDLGHAGDLAHPDVASTFRQVAEACRRRGTAFAVIGLPEALLGSHGLDLGATLVVATNDVNLLVDSGTALRERIRSARAADEPEAGR